MLAAVVTFTAVLIEEKAAKVRVSAEMALDKILSGNSPYSTAAIIVLVRKRVN